MSDSDSPIPSPRRTALRWALLVPALVVAEFLLDRLHLLVEVILALGLLHLALDARADALLDLQHRDLALHQPEHLLQALGDRQRLQDALAVGVRFEIIL